MGEGYVVTATWENPGEQTKPGPVVGSGGGDRLVRWRDRQTKMKLSHTAGWFISLLSRHYIVCAYEEIRLRVVKERPKSTS